MPFKPLLIFCAGISFSCHNPASTSSNKIQQPVNGNEAERHYNDIEAIPLPEGYSRLKADSNSFAAWLGKQPLKQNKTVYLFNGTKKTNQQAQYAVIDITVGNRDLQQCADAVMRLRAEYFFAHQRFTDIIFYDNNKTAYAFTTPYTREHFSQYLQQVFGMCGSASLSKQLTSVTDFINIQPGDVIIRGGFPGHAAIVMDVAKNTNGEKIFMLAQSYMPAQDIHVLKNPLNEKLSPWYEVTNAEKIITPEYIFKAAELKTWQ